MSIKVLFVFMLFSLAALVSVAAAVFFRVWWQMKARRAGSGTVSEAEGPEAKGPGK